MDVTIVDVSTRAEERVVVRLSLTGAEFAGHRVLWQPLAAVVTWERSRLGDGPWEPWLAMSVKVEGRNALAGGGLGAERHERMYGRDWDEPRSVLADVWDQAMRTRPTGDLPAPYRLTDPGASLVAQSDAPPPR